MNKHTAIRTAVLDALRASINDPSVTFFDGRPGFLDVTDLPAVAVYLTDSESTGEYIDGDHWRSVLHVEVFLKAKSPDSALDEWMENKIYPVMGDIPPLYEQVESISPLGYDYRRDDEAITWGSSDISYSLSYFK
ncbi:TPA: phage tail terminator protein [Yersinia enterocolitica]|uniref:phage tail terminator protein n=1 Tax=Yersinia enterocolitica TaxID=630 RepID=UPI0005DBF685|nr:phage tail terminator protein [Yersinia enterocolitica]ELI8407593.1 phage tail protein [Yersinia enterocolitica]CQR14526.1 Phage minor tail protein U [Yersinia enterocolitica]CRX55757.1 Phage minor tail protein U [Yersinia enterocolitica]HEN3433687.1 phage tail protein [Yersinia enterocolitica]HEN3495585.1 phage tail protein [Yersinia enterocolitica]